jgi:hypothetical protein
MPSPSEAKVNNAVGKGPPDKSGTIKFRHGSSARYDSDFAANQPWVKIAGKSEIVISFLGHIQGHVTQHVSQFNVSDTP